MISRIILILFCNLSFNGLSMAVLDIITPNQSLAYGQTLVSPNETFALGFFTPNGSTYSYLGVWYNKIPVQTIVWVANRQAPLKTRSNITLSLSSQGNLAIRNLTGGVLWSTNTSSTRDPSVQLLDTGNLVLTEGVYVESNNSGIVWQSFDYPSDTLLPGKCDNYGQCGSNGICTIENVPICGCLEGYEPKLPVNWASQDFSGGCVPRTPLDCGHQDTFVSVSGVKLPDTTEAVLHADLSRESCNQWCLLNCSCVAFAFTNRCVSWLGDLVDTRETDDWESAWRGENLYVRIAAPKLGNRRKRRQAPVAILVAVSLAIIILCFLVLLIWIRCKPRWAKLSAEKTTLPFGIGRVINLRESEKTLMSPLYPLSSIIQATDSFSYVNKLGEGGFGPVYKGKLIDGQEIAVKRLAAKSGQGREEFENEIILIAKLQHTNLVRLLGYCIHGEEKILIYEYMPNKSLDYFLYDTTRRAQLYWSKRRHIIEGISQGLLYLHKHSRPRIIHRDLKASNILLDADMNPKISDFGLARIFGTNETEANTNRVVGTYGYMSPEYAAEGLFSIKSDVFSFGVLLLEIVSGSKNTIYHRDGNTLNLLGYAWELWKEAKLLELFDPSFDENCPKHEISRCIHIALMCVQENAIDRPDMTAVIAMLSSDSAIADPKLPAFFNVRNPAEEEFHSVNEVTMTTINGR